MIDLKSEPHAHPATSESFEADDFKFGMTRSGDPGRTIWFRLRVCGLYVLNRDKRQLQSVRICA